MQNFVALSEYMKFTQLTERLTNFLRGWLLALGIKEGLVECATVCVKSEVILINWQVRQRKTAAQNDWH